MTRASPGTAGPLGEGTCVLGSMCCPHLPGVGFCRQPRGDVPEVTQTSTQAHLQNGVPEAWACMRSCTCTHTDTHMYTRNQKQLWHNRHISGPSIMTSEPQTLRRAFGLRHTRRLSHTSLPSLGLQRIIRRSGYNPSHLCVTNCLARPSIITCLRTKNGSIGKKCCALLSLFSS